MGEPTRLERAWREYSRTDTPVPELFKAGWNASRRKKPTEQRRNWSRHDSAAKQTASLATATRKSKRWEPWELEILYRPGLSQAEIAALTGRTFAGVKRARKNHPAPDARP